MKHLLLTFFVVIAIICHSQSRLTFDNLAKLKDSIFIEITAVYNPLPKNSKITLRFNGENWSVTKTENTFRPNPKKIDISYNIDFADVYRRLDQNNFSALPNQYEIEGIKNIVDDGVDYEVWFKVGNKIGKYIFDNPDVYMKWYPNIDTFRKYQNIVDIFFKELSQEQ